MTACRMDHMTLMVCIFFQPLTSLVNESIFVNTIIIIHFFHLKVVNRFKKGFSCCINSFIKVRKCSAH